MYLDATAGGGGYAEEILKRIGREGFLICLDEDDRAAAAVKERLGKGNFLVVRDNFINMGKIAAEAGITRVDGIVFDLGVSSPQIDEAERGFSFDKDGPLDMRFSRDQKIDAAKIVNEAGPRDIEKIIRDFGEERLAGPISRAIVRAREVRPLTTTLELASVIRKVLARKGIQLYNKTLARVFQALRIAVNQELANLSAGLTAAAGLLAPGGRLVVVSFHSLEDRIVKNYFRTQARDCLCPPQVPVCRCGHQATLKILTRKPLTASGPESAGNRRARSAKLRAAEKLAVDPVGGTK